MGRGQISKRGGGGGGGGGDGNARKNCADIRLYMSVTLKFRFTLLTLKRLMAGV